jgi:hypothetical protein
MRRKCGQPHKPVRYYRTPMNCSGQPFELRGSDNQGSFDQLTATGGAIDEYSCADIADLFAEGRENRPA